MFSYIFIYFPIFFFVAAPGDHKTRNYQGFLQCSMFDSDPSSFQTVLTVVWYAQTLILVNFILVKLVGFLVITRYHTGVKRPYQDTTFLSSTRTSLYRPGTKIQALDLSF